MTTKILLNPSDKLTKFSLTAVIEQKTDGKYQAILLSLSECHADGNTRDEAIASQIIINSQTNYCQQYFCGILNFK